ncbi:hypothetical protein WICPIJ_003471 [Wickerhamomyces pijperi]|uniref:Uncharacterized protein n=1 Tax=Wickerhamomyces pijperi TaxID=599730 RepID=A0A9P8Q9H9_WICPI|nr:hypothetical protein WICPIJ_003471 [Wickerhamomyces pijperi]
MMAESLNYRDHTHHTRTYTIPPLDLSSADQHIESLPKSTTRTMQITLTLKDMTDVSLNDSNVQAPAISLTADLEAGLAFQSSTLLTAQNTTEPVQPITHSKKHTNVQLLNPGSSSIPLATMSSSIEKCSAPPLRQKPVKRKAKKSRKTLIKAALKLQTERLLAKDTKATAVVKVTKLASSIRRGKHVLPQLIPGLYYEFKLTSKLPQILDTFSKGYDYLIVLKLLGSQSQLKASAFQTPPSPHEPMTSQISLPPILKRNRYPVVFGELSHIQRKPSIRLEQQIGILEREIEREKKLIQKAQSQALARVRQNTKKAENRLQRRELEDEDELRTWGFDDCKSESLKPSAVMNKDSKNKATTSLSIRNRSKSKTSPPSQIKHPSIQGSLLPLPTLESEVEL